MTWDHREDTLKVVKELKGSFSGNVYMSMTHDGTLDLSPEDIDGLSSQFAEAVVYEIKEKMQIDLDDSIRDELEANIKKEMKGLVEEMAVDLKKSTHAIYDKYKIDPMETSFDDALMDLNEYGVSLTNESINNAEFMKQDSTPVLEGVVNKAASTAMVMEKMKKAGIEHTPKPEKEPEVETKKTKWQQFIKDQMDKISKGSDKGRGG